MRIMPRWGSWAIGVVVIACAAGLVLVLALARSAGDSGQPAHPDAAALTAYTAALAPPTKEGGRIVQQEMKPSLGEFEQGQLSAADFVVRARGWQLELGRVRDAIDHVAVPPVIASAGGLFHQAMQAYIDAARLFEQAGEAAAADRQAALQRAVAAAREADRQFDQAAIVVQRALRNAGLPADHNLPDPSPTPLAS